jgi:hypothetical protein
MVDAIVGAIDQLSKRVFVGLLLATGWSWMRYCRICDPANLCS